ncbi:unnamed protein product [Moneuplotes crassus]|uniref:Phospholipid-transporting ATPase n=1 Tax=Euplotes crassus TaxID=5936 RepID=A0AAD1X724_EUPCR|nr:unnamed protein product [Moneuplotes crassus]
MSVLPPIVDAGYQKSAPSDKRSNEPEDEDKKTFQERGDKSEIYSSKGEDIDEESKLYQQELDNDMPKPIYSKSKRKRGNKVAPKVISSVPDLKNSSSIRKRKETELDEENTRIFELHEDNEGYPSNYIKTTKYNIFTFVPVSLLVQFFRIANIYFLIICILTLIPTISTLTPLTAILPLVFVLLVSMIREGIEDYYRYKSDKKSNGKKVLVLNEHNKFENLSSRDLKVGDIVLIHSEDTFPADIVMLKSSNGPNAFIQTSSLDGEKNLKKRYVPKGLDEFTKPVDEQAYFLGGTCTTLMPDKDLHDFTGKLEVNNVTYSLSIEQLMLKDSKLKNTNWIIGTVAFTGRDTKVMLNSTKSRIKISSLEKQLNNVIVFLFFLQILICALLSMIMTIYDDVKDDNQDYYLGNGHSNEDPFLNFFSFFLLMSTLIPISLIVTLEVLKVVQCYFITQDAQMFDVEAGAGTKVSSTTINEELGQVTYIFSDKTGTLTQNIMEFRSLLCGKETYGQIGKPGATRKLSNVEKKKELETNFKSRKLNRVLSEPKEESKDPLVIYSTNGNTKMELCSETEKVQELIKLLSVCHDCEAEEAVVDDKNIKFYQGASPDEITLVDFARDHGFEFDEANDKAIYTSINPESGLTDAPVKKEYKIHKKIPFTSDRARMSVLITDPDDGQYKLYIKGADSKIKALLDPKQKDPDAMQKLEQFLNKASSQGLRTLLMACRVLDPEEFDKIQSDLREAEADVVNAKERVAEISEEYEKGVVLLGATCVEDKLQENVCETLEDFRRANIKVWMLTGDKLETAKNIGFSCKLLTKEMFIFQAQGAEEAKEVFTEQRVKDNQDLMKQGKPRAIVFDSGALGHLFANPQSLQYFISIAKSCNAVVLSRASPAQKADIVTLISKDDPNNITLSIGDGANDVPMISVADVGIGIFGKEGVNAAQAADFAIHQFKYIWDLVLYHGRFNYIRNSELILYFFYKNVIFTIPQVYFAFISDFSAQTIFDDWYISFYNLFFTSMPIMLRSIFETDIDWQVWNRNHKQDAEDHRVTKREIIRNLTPRLYYIGNRKTIFTYKNYAIWLCISITHSIIAFFGTLFCYQNAIFNESGKTPDLWSYSVCMFFSVILGVSIRLMITQRLHNVFNILSISLLSIMLYYTYSWVSNLTSFSKTYLTSEQLHTSPLFYLTIFLCAGLICILDLFQQSILVNLVGSPSEYMRKVANNHKDFSEGWELEFNRLMRIKEQKYTLQDIKHENIIAKKRAQRMADLQHKLANRKK